MITKISSIEELKQIFVEFMLSHTNKVTKISDNSVLNGMSYGIAKVAQKTLKEIAVVESHLFPDMAFGDYLDNVAEIFGIAGRFSASGSSTYSRVVGDVGTQYLAGINTFTGSHGITFDVEEDFTIGAHGWGYVKLRSQDVGEKTNVEGYTINRVSPIPTGHLYTINEYRAVGGRDEEQDEYFRQRIKQGSNILARGTIAMLEQVFMKINNKILKIYHQGIDENGRVILAIATQNGSLLSQLELDELLDLGSEYFTLTDLKSTSTERRGIYLKNIDYYPIDISFRVDIIGDAEEVRKEIQLRISKYFDYRYWDDYTNRVEWDDLLEVVKNTGGVKYVPDLYFTPSSDILVDKDKLPLVRGFIMMDLNGNILEEVSGNLQPFYYPSNPDFSYWQTVLATI